MDFSTPPASPGAIGRMRLRGSGTKLCVCKVQATGRFSSNIFTSVSELEVIKLHLMMQHVQLDAFVKVQEIGSSRVSDCGFHHFVYLPNVLTIVACIHVCCLSNARRTRGPAMIFEGHPPKRDATLAFPYTRISMPWVS